MESEEQHGKHNTRAIHGNEWTTLIGKTKLTKQTSSGIYNICSNKWGTCFIMLIANISLWLCSFTCIGSVGATMVVLPCWSSIYVAAFYISAICAFLVGQNKLYKFTVFVLVPSIERGTDAYPVINECFLLYRHQSWTDVNKRSTCIVFHCRVCHRLIRLKNHTGDWIAAKSYK